MDTEDAVIAALLHDTVEDSDMTFEQLEEAGFSDTIIDALKLLTHDKSVPYFDYIQKIKCNGLARQVKLADLEHNSNLSRLQEVTEDDRKRAVKYQRAIQLLS